MVLASRSYSYACGWLRLQQTFNDNRGQDDISESIASARAEQTDTCFVWPGSEGILVTGADGVRDAGNGGRAGPGQARNS